MSSASPAFELDAWAGACALLVVAAHVLAALLEASRSQGPRVFENALLAAALQLALGGVIAYGVGAALAGAGGRTRRLAMPAFCFLLLASQTYFLRSAFSIALPAEEPRWAAALTPPPVTGPSGSAPAPLFRGDLREILPMLDQAGALADGDDRFTIEQVRLAAAPLAEAQQRQEAAHAALQAAGGIDLATFRSADDIRARLDRVEALLRASEAVTAALQGLAPELERRLETRFAEGHVRGFVTDFAQAARLDDLLALRAAETEFCNESRRLLTLLWRNWGRWSVASAHSKRPTFDDAQLAADFDRVMARVLRCVVDQARLRADLERTPSSPPLVAE